MLYLEIAEDIKYQILSSDTNCDYQLKPLRDLAQEYGANHITISKAIKLLENEGFTYKKRGKGTFVDVVKTSELKKKYQQDFLEIEAEQFLQKATQLGIASVVVTQLLETVKR